MIDLALARQNLPLPALMARLGYGDRARSKARCLFHDDTHPSFGVYAQSGRWFYKCHGCGEHGDEVDFIMRTRGMNKGDAIKEYGALAGVNGNADTRPAQITPAVADEITVALAEEIFQGKAEIVVPAIAPLTRFQIKQVAEWRGLSPEFVAELSREGVIGSYEKNIAFRVGNRLHVRQPKDGGWRWIMPKGDKLGPLVLGKPGSQVVACESTWDALSLREILPDGDAVIATLGGCNAKLVLDAMGAAERVVAAPQNDAPGRKWLCDLAQFLKDKAALAIMAVPDAYKDANDWRKAASDGDLFNAYMDAREYDDNLRVPAPDEPPVRCQSEGLAQDTSGEAREGDVSNAPHSTSCDSRGPQTNFSAVPVLAESVAKPEAPEAIERDEARESTTIVDEVRLKNQDSRGGGEIISETLDGIVKFLCRYMVFPLEEQAAVCALWAAHTWVYAAFMHTAYLHIFSPEAACGKSVLLDCLELLVANPLKFSNISEPALFRAIHARKPTVLWDEVDNVFKDEKANATLIGMLNDGYKAGAKVLRCKDAGKGGLDEFEVYCPKAFTGIGSIPSTVHTRSIDIELQRPVTEPENTFRLATVTAEAEPLRENLAKWAKNRVSATSVTPLYPSELRDGRKRDVTESILTIAGEAGETWKERGRDAIERLMCGTEDQSVRVQLLNDCRVVFCGDDKLSTGELLERLIRQGEGPWAIHWEAEMQRGNTASPGRKLSKFLKPFGIRSSQWRHADEVVRGYYRSDFEDSWARYLNRATVATGELSFE